MPTVCRGTAVAQDENLRGGGGYGRPKTVGDSVANAMAVATTAAAVNSAGIGRLR